MDDDLLWLVARLDRQPIDQAYSGASQPFAQRRNSSGRGAQVTPQLDFKASKPVQAALSEIGRTEDVRFSPDNRLLALAGYGRNHCLILRIDIELTPSGPQIVADDFMDLTSDGIGTVHGLDFIDDRTLAVANRDGLVSIVRLPPGELAGRHCRVDAVREITGSIFCKLKTPGSIAARREPNGQVSLLVCNNYTHRVTRHVVVPRFGYRVWRNKVLLRRGLNIPDGIALSNNGQWIAVSSHGTHDVKIFAAAASLGPDTEPVGTLNNANYPHGLRFTPDDRHVVVADAGAPLLHVYERGASWSAGRTIPSVRLWSSTTRPFNAAGQIPWRVDRKASTSTGPAMSSPLPARNRRSPSSRWPR